jgi:hypothetical protein
VGGIVNFTACSLVYHYHPLIKRSTVASESDSV